MKKFFLTTIFIICVFLIDSKAQSYFITDTTSQLNLALKQATTLSLTQPQTKQIRAKYKLFLDSLAIQQQNLDTLIFNRYVFESFHLTNILSPLQYNNLLKIKNTGLGLADAKSKWADAVQNNFTLGYNKDSSIAQMNVYFFNLRIINDAYAYDENAKTIAKSALDAQISIDLLSLIKGNPFLATDLKSALVFALRKKQQLSLSKQQIAQLFNKARIERQKDDAAKTNITLKYDKEGFQYKQLNTILTSSQFTQFHTLKFGTWANKKALNLWNDAVDKKATGSFSKDSAIVYLSDYLLQKTIITNRFNNDTVGKQAALANLESNISPEFLSLFNGVVYSRLEKRSEFLWALRNKQLSLSKQQEIQLLNKVKLEKQNDSLAKADSNKNYDKEKFQYVELRKILNKKQFSQYLSYKYNVWAKKKALNIWDEAKLKNATSNYVKDSAIAELSEYLLKKIIIKDQFDGDSLGKQISLANLEASKSYEFKKLYFGDVIWKSEIHSLLRVALINQSALNITQTQAKLLLQSSELLKQKLIGITGYSNKEMIKDSIANSLISTVLDTNQMKSLYVIKHIPAGYNYAVKKWEAGIQNGITTGLVKDTVVAKLTTYYASKKGINERLAHKKLERFHAMKQLDASVSTNLWKFIKSSNGGSLARPSVGGYAW